MSKKNPPHRLIDQLKAVYKSGDCQWLESEIKHKVENFKSSGHHKKPAAFDNNCALITYADSVIDKNKNTSSLYSLCRFLKRYKLKKHFSIIHLLPFYPWDTDKGFSVKDYFKVCPKYGDWSDIKKISKLFLLMFDFVANHASVENPFIQKALVAQHISPKDPDYSKYAPYKNFCIIFSEQNKPSPDQILKLARPRSSPVLTHYFCFRTNDNKYKACLGKSDTKDGEKEIGSGWIWTTFSRPLNKDGSEATRQVDLNYANPLVLLKAIDILLFYIKKEASFIRLDAIAYIWKRLGSSSIHEPKTHQLLAIMNKVIQMAAPHVKTIAEINESEDKYLPYLGTDSNREADFVYQFIPFPLAVHAVLTEQGDFFNKWLPSTNRFRGRQLITTLGTHDGMGLKPIKEVLPSRELKNLSRKLIKNHQNSPNYCYLPGGEKAIYEICSTPWNLVNNPHAKEPLETQVNRYLAVLALGLIPRGIPGIYINGLLGLPNHIPPEGLDENRTINRHPTSINQLFKELDDPRRQSRLVFDAVTHLLQKRNNESAFSHQAGPIKVLEVANDKIVTALLPALKKQDDLISVINVSSKNQTALLDNQLGQLFDIISQDKKSPNPNKKIKLSLVPYQIMWLKTL